MEPLLALLDLVVSVFLFVLGAWLILADPMDVFTEIQGVSASILFLATVIALKNFRQ